MHNKIGKNIRIISFDRHHLPQIKEPDPNNNGNGTKKGEKYSLRQRQKRQPGRSSAKNQTDNPSSERKVKEKPKHKAAPLSKYRRKTANARERTRMREINSAFENLRNCVPPSVGEPTTAKQTAANEKLTKITTLRLAMKYITILNDALTRPNNSNFNQFSQSDNCTSDTSLLFNSLSNDAFNNNNNIMIRNNNKFNEGVYHSIPSSPSSSSSTSSQLTNYAPSNPKTNKAHNKNQPKSRSKLNKINQTNAILQNTPIDNSTDQFCLSLESDGESLNLSESCLSPLNQKMQPFGCIHTSDDNNALEFGFLLDASDSDSLQLSEPCLSPLGNLDVLGDPFSELLNTGFSDHTNLDLYLT